MYVSLIHLSETNNIKQGRFLTTLVTNVGLLRRQRCFSSYDHKSPAILGSTQFPLISHLPIKSFYQFFQIKYHVFLPMVITTPSNTVFVQSRIFSYKQFNRNLWAPKQRCLEVPIPHPTSQEKYSLTASQPIFTDCLMKYEYGVETSVKVTMRYISKL